LDQGGLENVLSKHIQEVENQYAKIFEEKIQEIQKIQLDKENKYLNEINNLKR